MQLHVGTSGFAYKEWIGSFYPPGTREKHMLARYAGQLDAVEINSTFYRFPTAAGLAAWAAQVPVHFRFAIKAPRQVTHIKRLRNVHDDVARLLDAVLTLGPRLGPLLFLLPPRTPLNLETLHDLVARFPPGMQIAFEFRDPRWVCDDVYAVLAAHHCAVCFNDAYMEAPVVTAPWGYVRLRRACYDTQTFVASVDRILRQPWTDTYVFVKHEAPDSPRLAKQWQELATSRLR